MLSTLLQAYWRCMTIVANRGITLQLSFHPPSDSGYLCNQSWASPGVCDATCGRCTYCAVFEDPYCQVNIQVIYPSHLTFAPGAGADICNFFGRVR